MSPLCSGLSSSGISNLKRCWLLEEGLLNHTQCVQTQFTSRVECEVSPRRLHTGWTNPNLQMMFCSKIASHFSGVHLSKSKVC